MQRQERERRVRSVLQAGMDEKLTTGASGRLGARWPPSQLWHGEREAKNFDGECRDIEG